jgi:uncharacterized membrane protein YdbT with pleckstrin-like domain
MVRKKQTPVKDTQQTYPKYFDDQFDDEEVLFVFRKHPVVMRKGLILGMVSIMLGTVPALIKPEFSYFYGGLAGGFLLGVLLFFPSWLAWYYSVFIVTSQRFIQITQKGLFNRSVSDLGLNHIQTINYEIKGLQETLLGFGTIVIQTYMGDLFIHDVHHPAKTQKRIIEIIRDQGITSETYPENLEPISDEEKT